MTPCATATPGRRAGSQLESVDEFLAALASGAPTPGGGAAAALSGAMAAALVAMVGRVTAARDSSVADEASRIVAQADELEGRLASLVNEDVNAYRSVVDARRSGGPDAMERALVQATEVPMRLAAASRDVLALAETLAPLARRSALSDLAVASALAWGALESGALTARANLADVADAEFARMSESELTGLLASGQDARRRLLGTIAARAGRSLPTSSAMTEPAATVAEALARFPRERTWLLPALQAVQEIVGHLPDSALADTARHLRVPASEVYGVATDYPEFRRLPRGAHHVRVCTGVSCALAGGRALLDAICRGSRGQARRDGAGQGADRRGSRLPVRVLRGSARGGG